MADTFPILTRNDVLAFQFSSWYPHFKGVSMKSTIIRPLGEDFRRYLLSDGVHLPESSGNVSNDDEEDGDWDEDEDDEHREHFAFPELDRSIGQAIADYEAVFPKLNFSSPKDASWILPSSSPLKCTSSADVYMLLKSSDFINHDIELEHVFDGCPPSSHGASYELELVLRKWYHVDPSREVRCFVRGRRLIGISQRDPNFYDYMNVCETRDAILNTVRDIWDQEIREKWVTDDYTFDLILNRNLEAAHIIDFNPYAPRTDPLLFDYDELLEIYQRGESNPILKTIDSPMHEAVKRSSPVHIHNMVPYELLDLSSGRSIENFIKIWENEIRKSNKVSE